MSPLAECPCCGRLVPGGLYGLCVVCGWRDVGQGDVDADEPGDVSNYGVSLSQARANVLVYGIAFPWRFDMRERAESPAAYAVGRVFELDRDVARVVEPATGWRSERIDMKGISRRSRR